MLLMLVMRDMARSRLFLALLIALALSVVAQARPAHAGVAVLIEDAVKVCLRSFADDATRYGGKALLREGVERAVLKHGPEAAEMVRRIGPEGLRLLERHGDDLLRWQKLYGDEALRVASRPSFQAEVAPLVARHGERAILVEAKAPGMGGRLFEAYGPQASTLVSRLTPANAVRLGQCAPKLATLGKAEGFGRLVERFGDAVFETLERALRTVGKHPLGTGVTVTMAVMLNHPELLDHVLQELAKTPGEVAKALVNLFQDGPGQFPWRLYGMLACGTAVVSFGLWLRLPRRTPSA